MNQAPHTDPAPSCGLYIHVPFCQTKCGYCDFYSLPRGNADTGRLVAALQRELSVRLAEVALPVRTVFVGGGTPTVLPHGDLAALLQAIRTGLGESALDEFTVEANPATVDDANAAAMAAAGVDRVSLGAQSFHPSELVVLERLHSPASIAPSLATLRRHGIKRLNLDLIFGIPGQTSASWDESLKRTIDLNVEHIACYGLTYEVGTKLTKQVRQGVVIPCDENLEADLYLQAGETLTEAGYAPYEISNYARPGGQSLHNLIYWHNEPYIGIGPSATGTIGNRRYKNVGDLSGYISSVERTGMPEGETEILDAAAIATELILMQFRLVEGLSIKAFRKRTGRDACFASALPRLVDHGLVIVSDTHIALTRSGFLVADAVITELANASDCGVAP